MGRDAFWDLAKLCNEPPLPSELAVAVYRRNAQLATTVFGVALFDHFQQRRFLDFTSYLVVGKASDLPGCWNEGDSDPVSLDPFTGDSMIVYFPGCAHCVALPTMLSYVVDSQNDDHLCPVCSEPLLNLDLVRRDPVQQRTRPVQILRRNLEPEERSALGHAQMLDLMEEARNSAEEQAEARRIHAYLIAAESERIVRNRQTAESAVLGGLGTDGEPSTLPIRTNTESMTRQAQADASAGGLRGMLTFQVPAEIRERWNRQYEQRDLPPVDDHVDAAFAQASRETGVPVERFELHTAGTLAGGPPADAEDDSRTASHMINLINAFRSRLGPSALSYLQTIRPALRSVQDVPATAEAERGQFQADGPPDGDESELEGSLGLGAEGIPGNVAMSDDESTTTDESPPFQAPPPQSPVFTGLGGFGYPEDYEEYENEFAGSMGDQFDSENEE